MRSKRSSVFHNGVYSPLKSNNNNNSRLWHFIQVSDIKRFVKSVTKTPLLSRLNILEISSAEHRQSPEIAGWYRVEQID